jgi:hypothetical protein
MRSFALVICLVTRLEVEDEKGEDIGAIGNKFGGFCCCSLVILKDKSAAITVSKEQRPHKLLSLNFKLHFKAINSLNVIFKLRT